MNKKLSSQITRIDGIFSEVDDFNEEQDREVFIREGQEKNLHFLDSADSPQVAYVDNEFDKGKKTPKYTWNVINLDSSSNRVKIFKCSHATSKKIAAGLKASERNLLLHNWGKPQGFTVQPSGKELEGQIEE